VWCWVFSCSCCFRIIFYWQQPKRERERERARERGKKDYEWMIRDIKKERRTREIDPLSFFPAALSPSPFSRLFHVRVSKSSVKETRWWYTIRNNSNRDGRQIERNGEKSIYDEQVLFYSSVYLSLKDHLLLVLLVNFNLLLKSTFNVRFFVNKINWRIYSKGSRSNVIWHLI